jgi:(2Fe-2S) ferredoxin
MRYDSLRYGSLEQLPFDLVGEFLGFVLDKQDQPRALRLIWLGREVLIKLAKSLRDDRYDGWIPGMQVEVWGTQQFSKKKAKFKLNADRLTVQVNRPIDSPSTKSPGSSIPAKSHPCTSHKPASQKPTAQKPATIKVCGKPDCMKRGGKALCKTLEKALTSGDWESGIDLQFTGCMGKCSQGPNLVVMPDKKRYSKVTANDVPQLLGQHFQGRSA